MICNNNNNIIICALVAACLEYLEIVFERRIAQAHVHVRVTCAQTKGHGLGVGK